MQVETAKTTAVQAVTAEGDKQVQRVQEAAAGVEADREQINQNKADIAGLAEDITDLVRGSRLPPPAQTSPSGRRRPRRRLRAAGVWADGSGNAKPGNSAGDGDGGGERKPRRGSI